MGAQSLRWQYIVILDCTQHNHKLLINAHQTAGEKKMEIKATQVVNINVKTLKLHLKVSDRFTASLESATGTELYSQDDGYVPDFMPDQHYGDYVVLDIDLDTGQITNWETPTAEQVEDFMKDDSED